MLARVDGVKPRITAPRLLTASDRLMGSPLMPPLAPLAAHFSAGVRAAIDANNAVTKHLFLLSLYVHTGPAQATPRRPQG
jgi:hypothetical protein